MEDFPKSSHNIYACIQYDMYVATFLYNEICVYV